MDALSLLVGAAAVSVKVTLRPDGTLNAIGPDTPKAAQAVGILKQHKETLQRTLAKPAPAEPETLGSLYDVLCYCSPPVEVIEFLQMIEKRQTLMPGLEAWLRRWEGIRAGEPIPALDSFASGLGECPKVPVTENARLLWNFAPATGELVEAEL